jgi:predicted PurR-regulated permease PerM
LLVFAAILMALLLRGISDALAAATGLSPGWSLGVTVAGLVVAAVLLGWLLAAQVTSQVDGLSEQLVRGEERARAYLETQPWGRWARVQADDVGRALSSGGMLGSVTGLVSRSLGGAVDLLVIFFLGLYLALDPARYVNGVVQLVPPGHRERARALFGILRQSLGWWLVGRLLSMAEVGLLTALGLWLAGVPLPATLGLLTGLLNFVPNIGPVLASAVSALVGLSVSPATALTAVVVQTLVGGFDGFVVTPWIQQRTVSLPAGLILGSQVLAGVLLGGLGVVLATPLTVATVVLVRELYVGDVLGG